MTTWMRAALLAAGAALAAVPTAARTMQQKLEATCAADIKVLCPDKTNDADALNACLFAKRSQVGPDCLRYVETAG